MKNRILLIVLNTLFFSFLTFAQEMCGSYKGYLEDDMHKYPQFYNSLENDNKTLEEQNEILLRNIKIQKNSQGKKIIPVVVHVVHDGGNENIPFSDIQNAIDALNKNINGQSDKFLELYQGVYPKTPDVFAARRGVANVEFRLANLTPVHPNCDTCTAQPTNGVVRVQSEYTNGVEPNNLVKTTSYWNSYQYLNIWVVKNILSDNGGITLGYAQFPNVGSMSTDGIVILYGEMADPQSTTLTHEVGHWLGLCHTWHCSQGTCGDDGVDDTPQQHNSNGFTDDPLADSEKPNPSKFPWHVGNSFDNAPFTCVADSLNPAGEMFMNYMDYTNDNFCTMFTKGQVDIFNETLDGVYDATTNTTDIGYREYMWSQENLEATGVVDGYVPPSCSQKADFVMTIPSNPSICVGEMIRFKGNKTMFEDPTSISWDFGLGETNTTTQYFPDSNLVDHTFNSAGEYDVSITINYNQTTESRSDNLQELLATNPSSYDSIVENLIVQGTASELINLGATNISMHLDEEGYSLDSYWKRSQFTTDSLTGAFNIESFQAVIYEDTLVVYLDGGGNIPTPDTVLLIENDDSTFIIIDSGNITPQDYNDIENPEINTADSSIVIFDDILIDYLDSIVDYNFYFDTTVTSILTFIDSTFLTSSDSSLLASADSTWYVDGFLNSSDSIRIFFAQFNSDTTITISVNTDTTSLTAADSLLFIDADSTWQINNFVGWVDTLRTLTGKHYYTLYNGYYSDTMFYRGEIQKVTYVAYYNNTCTSSTTKEKFITVSNSVSSSDALSYSYSFENQSDLNSDWLLNDEVNLESQWGFNTGQSTSWVWENGTAVDGTSSLKILGDDMVIGTSAQIISKAYDLSNLTTPAIKFSWSGASVNTFPVNEIIVSYSVNCGKTWTSLGVIGSVETSNAGLYANNFVPKSNEWTTTVLSASSLNNSNVRFKIEYLVNGNSNNFYLDHILIGEETSLMTAQNKSVQKMSLFPNPANGNTTVSLENIQEQNVTVSLINVLGAEVYQLFNGEVVSRYQEINVDLSSLEKGIYFINVISKGDILLTDKLVIK